MSSKVLLVNLLDHSDPIFKLTEIINWDYLEATVGKNYVVSPGRPELPVRLIVGLHYLKYLENKSDEEIVKGFVRNPYWQYFCGCEYFEHKVPLHPTTLVKWRKKIGIDNLEKLLKETINIAKRERLIDNFELKRVNIDTTVQEKAVTFPTDAKLYHHMRRTLVKAAKQRNLTLRQTYERIGQRAFIMQSRYAHARQMRRSRAQLRKLKTYLGRTIRDIERQCKATDEKLFNLLKIAKRIFYKKERTQIKFIASMLQKWNVFQKEKHIKNMNLAAKFQS